MNRNALAVMAKYPRPGEVKTRLAATLGKALTVDLYVAFLNDIHKRFAGEPRRLVWCFTPADADFAALFEPSGFYLAQRGDDLGQRMLNAFGDLQQLGFASVVMIGADVPHIAASMIEAAEAHLQAADVVLGPSRDGGYYLIAMRQPHDVFSGIAMSTPAVLSDTLARCEHLRLQVALLPPSFDIDEEVDLEQLRGLIERGDTDLPHTAQVLRHLNPAGSRSRR